MKPHQGVEEPLKGQGHLRRKEAKQPTPRYQPGMGAMGTTRPTLLTSLTGSDPPKAAQPCATPGPKSPQEGGPPPLPHRPSGTLMPERRSPLGATGPSPSPRSIKYSSPLPLNNGSTRCQEGHSSSTLAEAHTQPSGAGLGQAAQQELPAETLLGRYRQGSLEDGSKRGRGRAHQGRCPPCGTEAQQVMPSVAPRRGWTDSAPGKRAPETLGRATCLETICVHASKPVSREAAFVCFHLPHAAAGSRWRARC